jgi:hypothetical protein
VGFFIEIGIRSTASDVMLCHRLIAAINMCTYNKNRQIVNEMVVEWCTDHEHTVSGCQLCLLALKSHWCFLAVV